ncbi:MAG: alpha/beta hydrolase [Parcubacteria group bacterium]|jgi:pimeloyl-ACP methyl ester carboxylesterase
MLQKKNIIIQNLNIQYFQSEKIDKNNALVFLHGWGSCTMHFRKTLEKCENFIAVDLPGFGNSEISKTAWSLDDYASFIKEFLKKLNIENPIIAGHSFGGSIGIKYCSNKNKCKKLLLIGSAGIRRKKNAKKYGFFIVAKIFGILLSLPPLCNLKNIAKEHFYRVIDSADYINAGALTETYRKVIREDLTNDLKKINVPTILIWGENDNDTPLRDGKLMQKLISNSRLFIVPNAKHYVFLDNEKKFDEIFLSQIK